MKCYCNVNVNLLKTNFLFHPPQRSMHAEKVKCDVLYGALLATRTVLLSCSRIHGHGHLEGISSWPGSTFEYLEHLVNGPCMPLSVNCLESNTFVWFLGFKAFSRDSYPKVYMPTISAHISTKDHTSLGYLTCIRAINSTRLCVCTGRDV